MPLVHARRSWFGLDGRRRTFRCNDRFSRSKLLLHVLAKRQPNPNIRMRSEATNSKLVRLLIPLNGTRHLSVHDAHAPATRLRRAARVHELTIAAGIDSSSTFVRQDGGVAPTDAKRVLQCHPESVRLRRSPAAKRLATGSLDRKIGDRLQGVVATQPAADAGRRQR